MALDLWFREDVARILASTQETMVGLLAEVSLLGSEETDAYHRGFVDALRAVGIAFGVADGRPSPARGQWLPGASQALMVDDLKGRR